MIILHHNSKDGTLTIVRQDEESTCNLEADQKIIINAIWPTHDAIVKIVSGALPDLAILKFAKTQDKIHIFLFLRGSSKDRNYRNIDLHNSMLAPVPFRLADFIGFLRKITANYNQKNFRHRRYRALRSGKYVGAGYIL